MLHLPGCLQPIETGHHCIHKEHIRAKLLGELDGLPAIAGGADNLDIVDVSEEDAESLAHHGMVINGHDLDDPSSFGHR